MNWMQTTVPHGTDPKPIRSSLFNLAMAGTAGGKLDTELAIFSREAGDQTVLLLSPRASRFAFRMPGEWVEVSEDDLKAHAWKTVYTTGVDPDELGLTEA